MARDTVPAGQFAISVGGKPQPLPARLWFMPDGRMTFAELEFVRDGETRRVLLSPATLFDREWP
jgi:hypothetical protein